MRVVTNQLPRYGIAVLTTAGASLLALLLSPLSLRVPFALFAAAVLASSLYGGFKPGLLATACSTAALSLQYWLLPLVQVPESEGEVIPLIVVFVIVGLLSSYLGKQCWQAVHAVEWIEATLANFGDGLIFTDAAGRVTFMNPAAHSLTGWSQDEAAKKALGHVHESTDQEVGQPGPRPVVRVLGANGHAVVAEPALLHSPNGEAQPVDTQAAAIRNGDGSLLGAMLLLRDVRAARQAETDLRQREEQFRSLAACARVGILQMDPDGRCVYANCFSQLTGGFSAEEALGDDWAQFLHPDDRAAVVPAWLAAMHDAREFTCEFRFQTPEESSRWVRLESSPMYSDAGKLIGHVAILTDIAGQKRAEEALRETQSLLSAVVEEFADAIFVKNLEGRYVLANAAGAELLGKPVPEIIGKKDSELVAADLARLLKDCSGPRSLAEQGEGSPDRLRQYVSRKTPFRDDRGKVVGSISVCRETTEERLESETVARQRAEERLRDAETRLEALTAKAAELEKAKAFLEQGMQGRRSAETLSGERRFLEEMLIRSRTAALARNGRVDGPGSPYAPHGALSVTCAETPAGVHGGYNGRPATHASAPMAEEPDDARDWLSFD